MVSINQIQSQNTTQSATTTKKQEKSSTNNISTPKNKGDFWDRNLSAIIGITSIALVGIALSNASRARKQEEAIRKKVVEEINKNLKNGFVAPDNFSQANPHGSAKISKFTPANNDPRDFRDVIGMKDVKDRLRSLIIDPMKDIKTRNNYTNNYGIHMPSGILLTGKPGNGKTHIVKALAGEMDTDLYMIKGSDFHNSYIHGSSKRFSEMIGKFKEIAKYHHERTNKDIVLFIDELDGIVPKRKGEANSTELDELSGYLQELHKLQDHHIILIGATNRQDLVDKAILRNGRFGEQIPVNAPDKNARKDLLKFFLGGNFKKTKAISKNDKELDVISNHLDGFSNSDIEGIVDNAKRKAASSDSDLHLQHFEDAIKEKKASTKSTERNVIKGFGKDLNLS